MKYLPQVKVSKEDFLALSDLAGDMSIMDYMSKVIHEHVAAQQSAQADVCPECKCGDGLHEDDCSIAADMVIKSFHA